MSSALEFYCAMSMPGVYSKRGIIFSIVIELSPLKMILFVKKMTIR